MGSCFHKAPDEDSATSEHFGVKQTNTGSEPAPTATPTAHSHKHHHHHHHHHHHRKKPRVQPPRKHCATAQSVTVAHLKYSVSHVPQYEIFLWYKDFRNMFVNLVLDELPQIDCNIRNQAMMCKKMWGLCFNCSRHIVDYQSPAGTPVTTEVLENLCHEMLELSDLPKSAKIQEICCSMLNICVHTLVSPDEYSYCEPDSLTINDIEVFPAQNKMKGKVDFYILPAFYYNQNRQAKAVGLLED